MNLIVVLFSFPFYFFSWQFSLNRTRRTLGDLLTITHACSHNCWPMMIPYILIMDLFLCRNGMTLVEWCWTIEEQSRHGGEHRWFIRTLFIFWICCWENGAAEDHFTNGIRFSETRILFHQINRIEHLFFRCMVFVLVYALALTTNTSHAIGLFSPQKLNFINIFSNI